MSDVRITVTRWTYDADEPDVATHRQLGDGTWQRTNEPSAPPKALEDLVFVDTESAVHIVTDGTTPPASVIAAALPRSSECLRRAEGILTGNDLLDRYVDAGVIQVVIDEQRWAPYDLNADDSGSVIWLECDLNEFDHNTPAPAGDEIAWASGIELGSMTSGTFSWSIVDIGNGFICFTADPDDDENTYIVEPRNGRTNLELAQRFVSWVDWGPVSDAVARAIELGGDFTGVASELDSDWSDSCEVSASVDLSQD